MTIFIVALAIFIIILAERCFTLTYLYQIKEYRFDRFRAFLKEDGIFKVLYGSKPRMPANTTRNMLIVLEAVIVINLICGALALLHAPLLLVFSLILIAPFLAFLIVSDGVGATGLLAVYTRRRIIARARAKIAESDAIFIAITGSYGKTSVKEYLYTILSQKYRVAKTDANMNTDVGVALSVLKNLKPDTQYFITEAGAYRIGEIAAICGLIRPTYGILTAIANQHLALFGSRSKLISAKSELLAGLPKDGIIYINRDIEEYPKISKKTLAKIVSFSLNKKADIDATNIQISASGTSAFLEYKSRRIKVHTSLIGRHIVANLMPAVALAIDLGVESADIESAIKTLKAPNHTLQMKKGIGGSRVMDDSYNSSVEGFIAAIEAADQAKNPTKFIVSRGIIELGNEKKDSYRRILKALEQSGKIELLTTDKLFAMLGGAVYIRLFNSERTMQNYIQKVADHDTLIVLEGKFTPKFLQTIIK